MLFFVSRFRCMMCTMLTIITRLWPGFYVHLQGLKYYTGKINNFIINTERFHRLSGVNHTTPMLTPFEYSLILLIRIYTYCSTYKYWPISSWVDKCAEFSPRFRGLNMLLAKCSFIAKVTFSVHCYTSRMNSNIFKRFVIRKCFE